MVGIFYVTPLCKILLIKRTSCKGLVCGRKPGLSALQICTVCAVQPDSLSLCSMGVRHGRGLGLQEPLAYLPYQQSALVLVEGESRLYSMTYRLAGSTLPAVVLSPYMLW